MMMSTHSTLVEMTAALLQPCVCRLLASDQVEIPKSKIKPTSQQHMAIKWCVVVPAYIKRVIDHHCLGT